VAKKWWRDRHRARVAEASKRYRARHPERVAEARKSYRERNRARLAEYDKRYQKEHRTQIAENKKRYRERHPERVAESQKRYKEKHVANNEKKRTREKLKALGPLKLTIPLTDYLKSGHTPVTRYLQAFCNSLESADTNVSPTESFVQLLEGDSHTLIDLDSGTMQVADPPDWENLSGLQDLLKDMSPDDWQQVMNDVEDFDVEVLLPPEDLVHDMSSDEGVDLMYDLVS